MSRRVWAAVLATLLCAACTSQAPSPGATAPTSSKVPGTPVVYAAIGASETAGVGTFDPLRNAWPRVLWRGTLPSGSTLFDLGVPGSLASQALADQVPEAARLHPDLATVWLNVNDLIAGVPPAAYGKTMRGIVHDLRDGGGATVLVANAPRVDLLPAYLACRATNGLFTAPRGNVVQCPPDLLGTLPGPGGVQRMVDAYNAVISRVVRTEGAILVDLHGLGPVPAEHPEYIADDGFHPSNEGAVEVAKLFAQAWTESRTR